MRIECPLPPAVLWLAAALAPALASAQTGPYYLAFGQSFNHESNIYRLGDGVAPAAGATRADTVSISSLLAGVDQTISRQRLRADLALRASRFQHNDALDNQGHGVRLAWEGSTLGRLSGWAGANLDRSLVRNDVSATPGQLERNIATSRQLEGGLRWGLGTGWSSEASASHVRVDYSSPNFESREYRQSSVAAGLRWSAASGWGFNVGLRSLLGRYPRYGNDGRGNFFADRYDGRYTDFGARWRGSGVHELDARLSAGSTSYQRATATDYSGLTGALTWTWRPGAKLKLTTRLVRDRGQESSAIGFVIAPDRTLQPGRYADFSRVSTSLGSTLEWSLTAKVSLQAAYSETERDLRNTVTDTSLATGTDRSRVASIGARWQATRGIVLGCDATQERRRTDNTAVSSNLGNRVHSCFGQVAIP